MEIVLPVANQQELVDQYFQSLASYWKEVYETPGLTSVIYQQRQQATLSWIDRLRLPAGSQVLDIGCGAGFTAAALAMRGYHVYALDSVAAMLKLTSQNVETLGVGSQVTTTLGDAHALAFPSNQFPLVLALGVIPWLHSPLQALQEMSRVTQPGGHLIISADNSWRLNHWFDPVNNPLVTAVRSGLTRLFVRRQTSNSNHGHVPIQMLTVPHFDQLLASAGLEKVQGMTVGFGPFSVFERKLFPDAVGIKLHRILQDRANRGWPLLRSAGSHYIVIAKKLQMQ